MAHAHRDDLELDERAGAPEPEPVIPAPPVVTNSEVAAAAAARRERKPDEPELVEAPVREHAFTVGGEEIERRATAAQPADEDGSTGLLHRGKSAPRSIAPDFSDAPTWIARRA